MVAISTTTFDIQNPTLYPHNVFMYSIQISEQTAIISLYFTYREIPCLVFIIEMEYVYYAVLAESINAAKSVYIHSS